MSNMKQWSSGPVVKWSSALTRSLGHLVTWSLLSSFAAAQTPSPATGTSPAGTVAAPARPDTSQQSTQPYDMGAEVVKVLQQMKIEEPKPKFFPTVDPYDPINTALRTDKYVYDERLYDNIDSSGGPEFTLASGYFRRPVVERFGTLPMPVNSPDFGGKVADWDLVISNSAGENVRRISGAGNPPQIINWDGTDDRGTMLATGETYSFTFYSTDAAGHQVRVPGQPQRISGLLYQDRSADDWVTTMACDEVFVPGGTFFTDNAPDWFDAIGNVINEKFHSQVNIYVYSEKQSLAQDRTDLLLAQLRQRVLLPGDAVKAVPVTLSESDARLSRIEIQIY